MGKGKFKNFIKRAGNVVPTVLQAGGQLISGNVMGAMTTVKDALSKASKESEEASILLREFELKKDEFYTEEMREISSRWNNDMASDSWMSKNVRPLILIYLTLCATILIILDSSTLNFVVEEQWVSMLKALLTTVYIAYFGSRGIEKYKKLS